MFDSLGCRVGRCCLVSSGYYRKKLVTALVTASWCSADFGNDLIVATLLLVCGPWWITGSGWKQHRGQEGGWEAIQDVPLIIGSIVQPAIVQGSTPVLEMDGGAAR